jgi:hypothetical protein
MCFPGDRQLASVQKVRAARREQQVLHRWLEVHTSPGSGNGPSVTTGAEYLATVVLQHLAGRGTSSEGAVSSR